MTQEQLNQLGKTLWAIADQLRGAMNADDFRDYMLSFLFLRYLSDNYELAAQKELGRDYPQLSDEDKRTPLAVWYEENADFVADFEKQMRRKVHYVIKPDFLWGSIAELARIQSSKLLNTLQEGFKYIENESFESTFGGLFSEINLNSEKLGKNYEERNKRLSEVIKKIAEGINEFSTDSDALGDAYEYLIAQFASGSGKKAGEFYTPQQVSTILSRIVTLDSQNPASGKKKKLDNVLDFACGSGSLLLNVRHQIEEVDGHIGKIYGQEKNITTYNLARMNMLLHGFHFLSDSGTMAIILPHGVLFRGGAEEKIRTKLLIDDNIDAVIGLPANLFYSTGIPVCILVLKKCKKEDDVLFINAADYFEKGKRQNRLTGEHIDKIVDCYQYRKEEQGYSHRVSMQEIEDNGYNLNIARYVSNTPIEEEIDLVANHGILMDLDLKIKEATAKHNEFLKELGLPLLP